jgi:hypothetical protein
VSHALSEPLGQCTVGGIERAAYKRVGIAREDLMVVIVSVVEEDVRIRDTVFCLQDGVVYLRNAHEENAISSTNHERPLLS